MNSNISGVQSWHSGSGVHCILSSYSSSLLVFHVFCNAKSIPDCDQAPASTQLIALFISSLAGQYSRSMVANYLQGVHTWHIVHCLIWSHNDTEIKALLKAAVTLALTSSKCKPHEPYTIDVLSLMRDNLNLMNPAGVAVFACLTTTFGCTAHIGEFTVPHLGAFNPLLHIKPSNVMHQKDRQGLMVTNFHLPRTKSALLSKDISWAQQHGPSNPQAAFQNHIAVDGPPVDGHLFTYRHKGGYHPLTKLKFTTSLSSAAKKAGIKPLQGHGVHIGSTLKCLLHNVPFDVIKIKGQWASDAFLIYLCCHAQILAPYIQASPPLHESFLWYTMPPIHR
ncbi:hypothetical protein PAXRUDRAFT_131073 [Paxillus rubicundulus Ve08.2h10]|uniref:Uncharacterized protein n=1 Tax=Paxillus rubicundulus Ve08.2h10 TaxID=930991 RepID=A0A0D0DMD7_9AGAM|nr:hypothetical protein PAXRUDRAFT_131073 [Paxillus rubicundulus Ve08.2h10]